MNDLSHEIKLVCPECGGSAMVPLERLPGRIYCRRCRQWYKIETRGLAAVAGPPPVMMIDVAVRAGFSEWDEHQVASPRFPLRRLDRFRQLRTAAKRWLRNRPPRYWWMMGVAGTALLLSLVIAGWQSATLATPTDAPLPDALEERAAVFCEARLAGNVGRMLRLTEPARDRDLRRWLAQNPLPAGWSRAAGAAATVQLLSATKRGEQAEVALKADMLLSTGSQKSLPLRQTWVRREGIWYFAPSVYSSVPRPHRSTR